MPMADESVRERGAALGSGPGGRHPARPRLDGLKARTSYVLLYHLRACPVLRNMPKQNESASRPAGES